MLRGAVGARGEWTRSWKSSSPRWVPGSRAPPWVRISQDLLVLTRHRVKLLCSQAGVRTYSRANDKMRRAPTLTALLLLTAQASAWGSSPKKEEATTSESPAAAEVCASPAAGAADGGLTSQVSQLTEALGAQATRIAQLERMLAAKPAKPTKPAPAPRGAAAAAPAASLADLQPELQPFRLAEAQRALRRQQAQLQFEP